jgi:hypothetical protein
MISFATAPTIKPIRSVPISEKICHPRLTVSIFAGEGHTADSVSELRENKNMAAKDYLEGRDMGTRRPATYDA